MVMQIFLRTRKNRLSDPSEVCALDFEGEFRRFTICSLSATIGVDRTIFAGHRRPSVCGGSETVSVGDAGPISDVADSPTSSSERHLLFRHPECLPGGDTTVKLFYAQTVLQQNQRR